MNSFKMYPEDLARSIREDETKKKYRPSNGTEGMMFMEHFCERCSKEPDCEIIGKTMVYDETDEEYPGEWTFDHGQPCCTAFEEASE